MNNLANQDLRVRPVLCVTRGLGTAVGRITGKGLITEFSFSGQNTTLTSPQVRSPTHLRKAAPHAIMQSSER